MSALADASPCVKRRFASKHDANARLDSIDNERPRKLGRKLPVRAYACPRCRGYHLTSKALRP